MSKKPNPELIDDENPEWTAADFAKARPASEVLPQIFGAKVAQEMLKPVIGCANEKSTPALRTRSR